MENLLDTAPQVLEALQSDDSATIRSAAFNAGDMALLEAIPLLCSLVKSSNIGIQEAAEYALRKIRGPQVTDIITMSETPSADYGKSLRLRLSLFIY